MATLCSGSGTVTGAGVATARVTRDARERRAGATCRVRRVTPLRSEGRRGPDASASGASRVACGARGRTRCVRGGGWICEGNDSHLATTLLLAAPEDLARAWRRSPAELTMVAAIVRVVTRCLTLTKGRLDEVMTSRREFVHRSLERREYTLRRVLTQRPTTSPPSHWFGSGPFHGLFLGVCAVRVEKSRWWLVADSAWTNQRPDQSRDSYKPGFAGSGFHRSQCTALTGWRSPSLVSHDENDETWGWAEETVGRRGPARGSLRPPSQRAAVPHGAPSIPARVFPEISAGSRAEAGSG